MNTVQNMKSFIFVAIEDNDRHGLAHVTGV